MSFDIKKQDKIILVLTELHRKLKSKQKRIFTNLNNNKTDVFFFFSLSEWIPNVDFEKGTANGSVNHLHISRKELRCN